MLYPGRSVIRRLVTGRFVTGRYVTGRLWSVSHGSVPELPAGPGGDCQGPRHTVQLRVLAPADQVR